MCTHLLWITLCSVVLTSTCCTCTRIVQLAIAWAPLQALRMPPLCWRLCLLASHLMIVAKEDVVQRLETEVEEQDYCRVVRVYLGNLHISIAQRSIPAQRSIR